MVLGQLSETAAPTPPPLFYTTTTINRHGRRAHRVGSMSSNSLQAFSSLHLENVARSPASTTEDEFELEQQTPCQVEEPRCDPIESNAMANIVSLEDVPPDGGYGWVITACVFIANCHTWGVNASWAILLGMYEKPLFRT